MSLRGARMDRVLRVRVDRLERAVLVMEQARAGELRARGELELAAIARQQAETARRELAVTGGDLHSFIEAENWLRSCSIAEALAERRLRQARSALEREQLRVKDARIKVRQIEQLKDRARQLELAKEGRAQRVLEDEIAQRIARERGRRSP